MSFLNSKDRQFIEKRIAYLQARIAEREPDGCPVWYEKHEAAVLKRVMEADAKGE